MENDETQYDEYVNEIGYFARKLDTELTMFDRMKLTKSTLYRVIIAVGIYLFTMTLFMFIL